MKSFSNIFAVQDAISRKVAGSFRVEVGWRRKGPASVNTDTGQFPKPMSFI